MICISCGQRSKGREPTTPQDRRCQHCDAEVAFDPRAGDLFTDKIFAHALDRTSAEGKLRFTDGQLYYELRRILGDLTRASFADQWARWQAVYGPAPGLVTPWPSRQGPGPSEPDIGDYSFERVVITDSAWMVDFLLWNNFHFETNSAVLAFDGYPSDRFDLIRAMIRKNPQIIVIALHDASIEGCAMAQRLVDDDAWFRDRGYVIDVGLGPSHRELYAELWEPRDAPASPDTDGALAGLTQLDAKSSEWLGRYTLDLAVVRPEKAMRRLFRATRLFAGLVDQPDGPRVGEVHREDELLGAGWRKRVAHGEVVR